MTLNSEQELVLKKTKLTQDIEGKTIKTLDSKTVDIAPFANNTTKTMMAYNSLKIKKLENDLDQIMNRISNKILEMNKIPDEDGDIAQLTTITKEFENNTYSGSELINSDLGKLFKTLHFLLTKHKDILSKSVHHSEVFF